MRPHSDEDIIRKASLQDKEAGLIRDNKIDIAVDMEDDHGTLHTYVVSFERSPGSEGGWKFLELNELSSL
ncbi:hypothetical protein [Desertivirga xinjiangensis]|uniref:hypothetical protein n=1 Tax=Desertivirga xinjiangensis TaxID=539206 RepID=UPI00210B8E43|nr:hypothetical protein [Pedobacter xinjiangensis]